MKKAAYVWDWYLKSVDERDIAVLDIINIAFGKVKDSAEAKLEKGKEVLVRYTEQIAVMLVTSCLVPVAVLLFVFWVSKTIIGMDIPLPKRKSLRLRRK